MDVTAKRRGKAASLRAGARSWEGAALKIECKGAALLQRSAVFGRKASWGPRVGALPFIPREPARVWPGMGRAAAAWQDAFELRAGGAGVPVPQLAAISAKY